MLTAPRSLSQRCIEAASRRTGRRIFRFLGGAARGARPADPPGQIGPSVARSRPPWVAPALLSTRAPLHALRSTGGSVAAAPRPRCRRPCCLCVRPVARCAEECGTALAPQRGRTVGERCAFLCVISLLRSVACVGPRRRVRVNKSTVLQTFDRSRFPRSSDACYASITPDRSHDRGSSRRARRRAGLALETAWPSETTPAAAKPLRQRD